MYEKLRTYVCVVPTLVIFFPVQPLLKCDCFTRTCDFLDGVGGLVKRMARKASLKRPVRDQIVNATDLFKYCHEELEGTIHFIFIDQLDMQAERMKDKNEAKVINTIPGTLSYHYFVPLDRK